MILSVIVAKTKNNVIGLNNGLPWNLSDDLKSFKRITAGHPIIMGRKTFDSMGGKPLKNRPNIVVTRQKDFKAEGIEVVHSLQDGIELAKTLDPVEGFIIGGAELINQGISMVDKIYLTEIDAEVEGDTFLNSIHPENWDKIEEQKFHKSEKNDYDFSIIQYVKKRA
jgi:dihydrofolate reductase